MTSNSNNMLRGGNNNSIKKRRRRLTNHNSPPYQQHSDTTAEEDITEVEEPLPLSAFCPSCTWQEGVKYTCSERAEFLILNYELTEDFAIESLLEEGFCIDPEYYVRVAAEQQAAAEAAAEAARLAAEEEAASKSGGGGVAIGGAIGGILIVLLIVAGLLFRRHKRNKDMERESKAEARTKEQSHSGSENGEGYDSCHDLDLQENNNTAAARVLRTSPSKDQRTVTSGANSATSTTSSQIYKKINELRLKKGTDTNPVEKKREENMSRKELLELLHRERGGKAADNIPVPQDEPSETATEEASVEIWIECTNNTCEQSVLTFDDDLTDFGSKSNRPDPTGDTNHVASLPVLEELPSSPQEAGYASRYIKREGSLRSSTTSSTPERGNTSNGVAKKAGSALNMVRRLSNSAKHNPNWLGSDNHNDHGEYDDRDLRSSAGSKATMVQALNPKDIAKAKAMKYPQGDVTIIYTDVQGSTKMWEACPSDMKKATDIHDRIMRQCYTDHQGYEITTEGDAFNLAFQHPADALAFALQAQAKLYKADWPEGILKHPDGKKDPAFKFRGFRVRFGLHHGPTTSRVHEMTGRMVYYGEAVKIAKTVEGMCHGGQILTTSETWKAVSGMAERYLGRPQVLDCGEHLLFERRIQVPGPEFGKVTTRYTKRIMQLVPSALAFDFFEARGRRDVPTTDGQIGFEIKDASTIPGRLFPPLIGKEKLTTCFLDAPYTDGRVTICFVYTIGLDENPDNRAANLGILARYVRKELLDLSPPGYECQEDNGCWMLAFDTMAHAVTFGLQLKAAVQQAGDLVGRVDRQNMFKVGIVSGPFTSMGPHKTTGMADYFGPIVNRAARVASNCESGQVCIGMPLPNSAKSRNGLGDSDRLYHKMDSSERTSTMLDHEKTTFPRNLTQDETSSLRMMLKSKLNISEDNEEDADDLLDYAIDMIENGKSVGYVLIELLLMEMEVFPADVSDSFGKCLSEFLLGLDTEEDVSKGKIIEQKNDDNTDLHIDLGPTINVRLQGIKKLKGIAIDVAIFSCMSSSSE